MKLRYGYDDDGEISHFDVSNNIDVIKEKVNELLQIYHWVKVIDNNGNDVTKEYI